MLWGMTEEQLAQLGLTWGVGAFIAYMLFIIWKLARDSKAGRFGTFMLLLFVFLALALLVSFACSMWESVLLSVTPSYVTRSVSEGRATGRLLRDAKLYEIGAGTSEIRRMLIGRELFKETA